MLRKRRFERLYMKYIVKSSGVFCVYMGIFFGAFFIVSSRVELEERQAYEGRMDGDAIEIACGAEMELVDDRVYLYRDRNQEVFSFDVKRAEYRDGVTYIYIVPTEEKKTVSGEITVEVISGKKTLFQKIFGKAGTA